MGIGLEEGYSFEVIYPYNMKNDNLDWTIYLRLYWT